MSPKLTFHFVAVFVVSCAMASWNQHCFADDQVPIPSGVASDGLPGFFNLGIPYTHHRQLSFAGTARYGIIESIGPISGTHHELGGTLAVGGVIVPWISAALLFDGKYQKHPDDAQGSDSSLIGVPVIKLRGGAPVGRMLLLGGEIETRIPGEKPPSLKFNAAILTARVLATVVSLAPFYVGATLGFRLDNSENVAPAYTSLRSGDRVALDISSYNAVVFGLAMAYQLRKFRFILEGDSLKYISADAPFSQSPTRITAGARYAATDALQFDLYTETIAGKRPDVRTDAPLLPILPRFSIFVGMRYTLGGKTEASPAQRTDGMNPLQSGAEKKKPVAEPIKPPPTGTVSGRILDGEGLPITEATVTAQGKDGTETTGVTDAEGTYRISGVPVGAVTVTVAAEYFETASFNVDVTEGGTAEAAPVTLVQSKMGSQIRGLVRDQLGNPLPANIRVLPGKLKTKTNNDGFFEVDVVPGDYTVEISSTGFVRQNRAVTVGDNSVVILNVDLTARK